MTRDNLNKRELEEQRKQAVEVLERGFEPEEVAEIFDVAAETVFRWKTTYDEEGLEGLESDKNGNCGGVYLENISVDYLKEILEEVDSSKSTQRIMVALDYKNSDRITQEELSEKYNVDVGTIRNWFNRLERLEDEPLEDVVYDAHDTGHRRILSEEELSNLEDILFEGPEAHGFSDPFWTGNKVADIVENEFGESVSTATGVNYLRKLGWNRENLRHLVSGRKKPSVRSIENTESDTLQQKLDEMAHKPTQRLIMAILYKKGFSVPTIANWFNLGEDTLYSWFHSIEHNSLDEAIYDDDKPGGPRKLPEETLSELESLLEEGAESCGFTGQIWTGPRVSKLIRDEFDISVEPRTARVYLKEIGWSNKKPRRVAAESNKNAIKQFRNEEWMNIRDTAITENNTIVFIDETKFRLLPTLRKTWAPKGERAVIETSGLFEYIAVAGAIIYIPELQSISLRWKKQRYNFDTESLLPFFNNIVENTDQEPVFILDNWSPHKSATAQLEQKSKEISEDYNLKWFPEYTSGINPVDNVWGHAKYNELPNYAPKDLDELASKVEEALTEIRADEDLLRYFIEDAGLEIEA